MLNYLILVWVYLYTSAPYFLKGNSGRKFRNFQIGDGDVVLWVKFWKFDFINEIFTLKLV